MKQYPIILLVEALAETLQPTTLESSLRASELEVVRLGLPTAVLPYCLLSPPDLILLSLPLPGNEDVETLCAQLRATPQCVNTPLLLLLPPGIAPTEPLPTGATAWLTQPLVVADLLTYLPHLMPDRQTAVSPAAQQFLAIIHQQEATQVENAYLRQQVSLAQRSDATHTDLFNNLLRYIAIDTARLSGTTFFTSLAKYLAHILCVPKVIIASLQARPYQVHVLGSFHYGTLHSGYNLPYSKQLLAQTFASPFLLLNKEEVESIYPQNRQQQPPFAAMLTLPLRDQAGEPLGAITILDEKPIDQPQILLAALQIVAMRVTYELEKQRVEKELLKLSAAVEQSSVSIVITDAQGNIEYVNPKFTKLTGYTITEVIGSKPSILKSGLMPDSVYAQLWQTITSGKDWQGELQNRRKDGTLFWERVSIYPIVNEQQQITHFVAIKEDITEHKAVRDSLHQRNQELETLYRAGQIITSSLALPQVLQQFVNEVQSLLQVAACSVWLVDEETGDIVCQEATEPQRRVLHGWRLPVGQGFVGWVAAHGRSLNITDATTDPRHYPGIDEETGETIRSILSVPLMVHQRAIGVLQMVDEAPDRFTMHEQQLAESLAAIAGHAIENARLHTRLQQQLELLKRTRDRLVQSEKLAAVGELVAGVAHELNNPLAAAILHAQLLQMRNIPEEFQHDLQQVVQQSRRASKVVRSLLDFARPRVPERKPLQINELLRSTLELLHYELYTHNIQVVTQFAEDVPVILADPHQLQQVFINLLHNARQSMTKAHGCGQLSIFTAVGASQFLVDGSVPQQVVRITIQDDGEGIAPELQGRIFDPFFTTKEVGEGTGLGLSICYSIVSEHHGHIWVESQAGQGATFIVEIPVVLPLKAPASNTQLPAPTAVAPKAAQLLVVDDEQSVLNVVQRILQRQGYQVQTACSAEEALQYLKGTSYDLILCDLRMPGMSGQAFYEQLRLFYPQQVSNFILLTGDTISRDTRAFLQQTNIPYINKPFDAVQLIDIVDQQLAKRAVANAPNP